MENFSLLLYLLAQKSNWKDAAVDSQHKIAFRDNGHWITRWLSSVIFILG